MCDTLVALGNSTKDGSVIFAKNCDRQPNEPHLVIRAPRKTYPAGAKLACTYIEIDQVRETYDVLLLKPSWMWGAEMGANEFGLNIGNEAVFTKMKQGPPALLGMDLLRLALERCKTSEEALHLIIALLQEHGQGGNCGYEKPFFYHNSFLIADPTSAWVLETAGPFWAAEKVRDVRAISNRLSIGNSYDLAHPELVAHAIERKWCRSQDDFHFARCYSNRLFTAASGSAQRQQACDTQLQQNKGNITVQTMLAILRSHYPKHKNPFRRSSLKSVCMHGGGLIGDHATGSYAASLKETLHTYWLTGSSTPCLSLFKPYWMTNNSIVFDVEQEEEALDFWLERELLHRLVLENKIPNLAGFLKKRTALENEALTGAEALGEKPKQSELNDFMQDIWEKEKELVRKTVAENQSNPGKIRGNPFFRSYWTKQSRNLFGPPLSSKSENVPKNAKH